MNRDLSRGRCRGLVLALSIAGVGSAAFGQGNAAPNGFQRHEIDAEFQNGYQVSVADINRDGNPDIIALSTQPSQLVWYRNPDWAKFSISTQTHRNIDCAPLDVDGDGDQDLALASDFDLGNSREGGAVQWLECPANPQDQQEWLVHPIDTIPTSHRVRWADIDGDGTSELVNLPIVGVGATAPAYDVGVQFVAYRIPAHPASDSWHRIALDSALNVAHGLLVVPGSDRGAELLTASFGGVHRYRWREGIVDRVRLGAGHDGERPGIGSSEVGQGRFGEEQREFVATIEPWHGNEVVVYRRPASGETPWPRSVIDDTLVDGHGLVCVDLNNDGVEEIVAGGRGGAHTLLLFRWDRASELWQRQVIDPGGIALAGIIAADMNGDGNMDLVATGTSTHNVVWYENLHGR